MAGIRRRFRNRPAATAFHFDLGQPLASGDSTAAEMRRVMMSLHC
jgi:hypothetical protein